MESDSAQGMASVKPASFIPVAFVVSMQWQVRRAESGDGEVSITFTSTVQALPSSAPSPIIHPEHVPEAAASLSPPELRSIGPLP